ncbi:putative 7-deoxyloganetin glucosyltransferase [Dioscorea sansibarensis]
MVIMSSPTTLKPHAVCMPCIGLGHLNPMLKLAKLLHSSHGFHITFVLTELVNKNGHNTASSLHSLPDFQFITIQDGLNATTGPDHHVPDVSSIIFSIQHKLLDPLRVLLAKLNHFSSNVPPVTCVISDACMSFTLDVAAEIGVPDVFFCCSGACAYMSNLHLDQLIDSGLVPLKSGNDLSNGYLETEVDCIPGMKSLRLKDFSTCIRTTDISDIVLNFCMNEARRARESSAIIINTFDSLEQSTLDAMRELKLPPIYTIGPLTLLNDQRLSLSQWEEDERCVEWLNGRVSRSVMYVNFGSGVVLSKDQLVEFAWGLANSEHEFLWVIRPNLVHGSSTHDSAAALPQEFMDEIKERGRVTSWCAQEKVIKHPSIGVFLTHCGWNSIMESISNGVPMLCWPCFADQQMNCRYVCHEWGVGMEIENDVKREKVERLIRDVMEGDKGKEMKKKMVEFKELAERAVKPGGSSFENFNKVVMDVLL